MPAVFVPDWSAGFIVTFAPDPILIVVAAPAKFTVVAVVFTSAKVVEGVVSEVVMAGDVPKTATPVPVSSVKAANRFALEGVAKKVATPVPKPEMPVLTGSPVALVRVPDVGVPRIGLTSVGVLANTNAPLPVSSVTAEIKLALDGVPRKVATFAPSPLTPVDIGKPVVLVNVPEVGVPSIGVTNVGEVTRATLPVPLDPVHTNP